MTDTSLPSSYQKAAYDAAYSQVAAIPFPDRKIEKYQKIQGKTVVSIGGGTGSDIAHLAKDNTVYVVDYSDASASIAKKFGLHPVQADLNSPGNPLPFSEGSIDILVLKDVLEHLQEPEQVLQKLLPLLKSDGYAVISLPNHFTLWDRIRILFGSNLIWKGILHDHSKEYEEWNYMHIRFFTWKGIRKFLKKNHLEITQTFFDFGPFGHYFSIPMYCEHLRLKKEQGLLTKKGQIFLSIAYPVYQLINFLFPASLRNLVCKVYPSAFTSCFYFHVRRRALGEQA